MFFYLVILLSVTNTNNNIKSFDMIEVNHVYRHEGKFCHEGFDQLIFWNWDAKTHGYRSMGWIRLDCRVYDDAEHKKEWENWKIKIAKKIKLDDLQELASVIYPGKVDNMCNEYPTKRFNPTRFVTIVHNDVKYLTITSEKFRVTHTIGDPEVKDKKDFPSVHRPDIWK